MKFTSQNKQLTFDLFRSSLEELDKTNRWVMLGDLLPWAEIEKRYNSKLNNQVKGAGNKPARLIIGAMIIKHKLNLGDKETIQMIQENPYMQYMCGLSEFGYLPATVLADKIYMSRTNRDILEDLEVRSYCKPLGRPSKDSPSPDVKARMAKAVRERNEIECSFGTGKRIYRADNIRAKLPETTRCWTGMCYFVKNVMKFLKELCHALNEIWHTLLQIASLVGIIRNTLVTVKY